MNKKEDLVNYDFQGWPVFKMNLKELLIALGGKINKKNITFSLDNPAMEVYPKIFVDDGMAYGIDESYITEATVFDGKSFDENDDTIYVNIFRESVPSAERKAELENRWEEDEKMVIESVKNFTENINK